MKAHDDQNASKDVLLYSLTNHKYNYTNYIYKDSHIRSNDMEEQMS